MKFKLVEAAESKICCICKKPFEGYGNNAEPVCSGTCCDECNRKIEDNLDESLIDNGELMYTSDAIDSFLQDVAQITGAITYADIKNQYPAEDMKKLQNLRRRFRAAASYDDEEAMNKIGVEVSKVVKPAVVDESTSAQETKLKFIPTSDFENKDLTNTLVDCICKAGIEYHSARKHEGAYYITILGDTEAVANAKTVIENCGFFKEWMQEECEATVITEDKDISDYEKEYENETGVKTCDNCGTQLNDQGTCPKCDDGEEDMNENLEITEVPAPYDKYFTISDYIPNPEESAEYQIGEEVEGYDVHVLAYLDVKPEYEDRFDSGAILVDDEEYPVVEIVGGRMYPVDIEDLAEDAFDDDYTYVENMDDAKRYNLERSVFCGSTEKSFDDFDDEM